MATFVAEQAWIDPRAELDDDVYVGPFCVIGPQVRIGRGSRLENNVTLSGKVEIGEFNRLYAGCVIGAEPQDLSYTGSATKVMLGDHNVIRECVTINRATEKEHGVTQLGSHNYLMACSHVAHDCVVGDHVIIANGTLLGGHVHVEDYASLSGSVAVHHYGTVGKYAFVGGQSRVFHDVPPFMLVDGHPARVRCINIVGLKRRGFSPETLHSLAEAHRLIYRAKVGLEHAREILSNNELINPPVAELLDFVEQQQQGKHGRSRERLRAA